VAPASRFDGFTALSGSTSLTTLSSSNGLVEGQPVESGYDYHRYAGLIARLFHTQDDKLRQSVYWSRSDPAAVCERTTARSPWLHEISASKTAAGSRSHFALRFAFPSLRGTSFQPVVVFQYLQYCVNIIMDFAT
jgi:hypothetical protein